MEGTKLYWLTSSNGFYQLINELKHVQTNGSSCIDFVFTDEPNLSVNSGVHASLHPNCHHQIVQTSLNLTIFLILILIFPPPYQRLIWDYKKTDSEKIRKALDLLNWVRFFSNEDIKKQVSILYQTI